ncbi:hypothetical protein [Pedobacter gandavensis]|uniref:hypothetical protein n=1 Tax=Pedobacter gandavensis TaxID=2679963 RepID=UPI00293043C4|nr:hypothetical protein [Pedobacter gandavensis]
MNTKNPLLIYRAWFVNLPMTLADHVAHSVFLTLARYEPLTNLRLKWDFSSHSIHCPGAWAVPLFNMLNHQVHLKQEFSNQQMAVILLCATQLSLQHQNLPGLDFKRAQYIKNLLNGDMEQATNFELELQHGSVFLSCDNFLDQLQEAGFNFTTIHSYRIKNP